MSGEAVRIGIIGIGYYAIAAHWSALKDDPRADVVAICRRDKGLLTKASELTGIPSIYTDWRKMIDHEQLDAVLVCTPPNLHAEMTIGALEAGLHVLVEKPMALTTADARSMIDANRSTGRHLMVGYNRRCMPEWRKARDLVRDGAIGTLRQISIFSYSHNVAHDTSNPPESVRKWVEESGNLRPFVDDLMKEGNWRGDPVAGGGGWFVDTHTHLIDASLWIAGSRARQVSCVLTMDGWPVERAITTQAHLENEVLFSLSYTNGVDADPDNLWGETTIKIVGDTGVISSNGGELELLSVGKRTPIVAEQSNNDRAAATRFVDLITGEGENPAPPDECAWAVELIEASYRSAEEKRVIQVD